MRNWKNIEWPRIRPLIILFSFPFLILHTSCNDSGGGTAISNPATQQPSPVATITSTPPPSPIPTPTFTLIPIPRPTFTIIVPAQWISIEESWTCVTSSNEPFHCDIPEGDITLFENRTFTLLDFVGGERIQGNLNSSDYFVLNSLATRIKSVTSPSSPLSCISFTPESIDKDAQIRLSDSTGSTYLIYDRTVVDEQICYRGNENDVKALFNLIEQIQAQYSPSSPSPSPRPTRTHSPSPSPSPPSPSPSSSTGPGTSPGPNASSLPGPGSSPSPSPSPTTSPLHTLSS